MAEKDKNTKQPIIPYLNEAKKEDPWIPNAPFEILHKYGNQVKRFRQGKIITPVYDTLSACRCRQALSAHAVVEIAKTKLLEQNCGDHDHPSCDNSKDVELIFSLLDAAKKFSDHQFDLADKLLSKCILIVSSPSDNPVERAAKRFAEALRQRLNNERVIKIDLEASTTTFNLQETILKYQAVILASEQKLPSSQVTQFTAVQTILDNVGSTAKRIHLIDFGIRTGQHWPIIMQALAARKTCPLELLKITAVGSSGCRLDETGKRLSSFAESMNLPFLFRSIVSEMNELKRDSFDTKEDKDEVLAVYSALHLWSKLGFADHLTSFLRLVKELNPCVMVVTEIEACTNTPVLIDRFCGALSFTIASFDCLDVCLTGNSSIYRNIIEEVFFRGMIEKIMEENGERAHRHAKLGFWREMFKEFDFVEMDLSESSLYQARLLMKSNYSWRWSAMQMDGKGLVFEWKGTPLRSLSAWKNR